MIKYDYIKIKSSDKFHALLHEILEDFLLILG